MKFVIYARGVGLFSNPYINVVTFSGVLDNSCPGSIFVGATSFLCRCFINLTILHFCVFCSKYSFHGQELARKRC
jgi:hypothetical protein